MVKGVPTAQLNVRISEELLDRFRAHCVANNTQLRDAVAVAIERHMELKRAKGVGKKKAKKCN